MSHRVKRLVSALSVGALAVCIAAGCMSDSTAPTSQSVSATRGAGSLSGSDDQSRTGLLGSILDPLVKLIVRVVNIPAGQAGSVTNGRWRLDVPAGAIAGDATVGIGVQSPGSSSCQLKILPEELNHFAIPVTVTANCRDIEREQLRDWVIWWFDPMQNKWVILESSKVNLTNGSVSAPLPHCSAYAVGPRDGKAGW